MAKLKPSEFRLLLMFGIVAFLLLNAYGYKQLTTRHNALKLQEVQLIGKLRTADAYAREETDSLQKEAWLRARVPVFGSQDIMKTFLLKFVEQRASSYGLTTEPQPREPELMDGYMRSILEIKVSGAIEPIMEFVYSLQDPEEFRSITSFDLKAKPKDPLTLFAEFTIEQWWNPDSPELTANGEAVPLEMPAGGGGGVEGAIDAGGAPSGGAPSGGVKSPVVLPTPQQNTPPAPGGPDSQLPVLNESGDQDNPQ
ncbi:MAG: hypothetical protein ACI9R3_001711 [Verrucomicrobiales bacterium]|jgi:hypothetical protein